MSLLERWVRPDRQVSKARRDPAEPKALRDLRDHKVQSGPAGATGPVGPAGLAWQSAWGSSSTYNQNDAVSYNGSTYIKAWGEATPVTSRIPHPASG